MVTAARFNRQWQTLADVASWLRASRADHYEALVAKGRMTEDEAFMDRASREAIETDWRAVADDSPRDPALPDVRNAWKVLALEQALIGAEAKLRICRPDSAKAEDWTDMRDAIACMIAYTKLWPLDPLGCQQITRQIRADISAGRWSAAA